MKLEPEIAETSIVFRAEEATRKLLHLHHDVVKAIWDAVHPLVDTKVDVFINPRLRDSEPMEWNLTITSPRGRRSLLVTQRKPFGPIRFSET